MRCSEDLTQINLVKPLFAKLLKREPLSRSEIIHILSADFIMDTSGVSVSSAPQERVLVSGRHSRIFRRPLQPSWRFVLSFSVGLKINHSMQDLIAEETALQLYHQFKRFENIETKTKLFYINKDESLCFIYKREERHLGF